MLKNVRKIGIFFGIVVILNLFLIGNVFATGEEKQDLKVLVIEINPTLKTITNKDLYPNNNGHPKVSEFFGQDTNKAINELKEDLEFASHGYLNIKLQYEYLDEFPTYKGYIKGTELNRFTEELYLSYSRSSSNPDKGDWYNLINNEVFDMIDAYSFDYEYLINKFDLVNRRNRGEFDQVWINSIDPIQTFETMMVGKSPYWINGTPLKKDCNNFIIANISISRRDANLHALGHGVEGIMSQVFNGTYFTYNKKYDDTTKEKFNKLNLWEQFSMTSSESTGNNSGIGNVHFPYNAEVDYDYNNTKKVYSYWKNWFNYPNLNGEKELVDSSSWLEWKGNTSLGDDQNKDPDRLYMRLWFYLFPHIEGVTDDGYLNNWWKYFVTLDYADSVKCKYNNKKYNNIEKEISDTLFSAIYSSGIEKEVPFKSDFASFVIKNTDILKLNKNNKLEIVGTGHTYITCYIDGKYAQYSVNVSNENGNYNVVFNSGILGNADEWAKEELLKAEEKNLIPETFFDNADFTSPINRANFAAIAVKLYEALSNQKIEAVKVNPFIDTKDEYVLKAYSLGITKGTSENTFTPEAEITREQMATMLTRAIEKADIEVNINLDNINKFSDDGDMHEWGRTSIYFMSNNGIIKGVGNNKFNVLEKAKIEDAIIIALRSVEKFGNSL